MTRKYYIIGITDDAEIKFSPEVLELISCNKIFSGGKRHHLLVKDFLPADATWIDVAVPLEKTFATYAQQKSIVVFASGDPLFFGFAGTILRRDPDAELEVFPSFNSLQMLAHRSLLPYEEMLAVSLTGRPWHKFDQALIEGRTLIGTLTDRNKTPRVIAQRMLDYGYDNYRMVVGSNLGNQEEQVHEYNLSEVVDRDFAMPNCLLLRQTHPRSRPFGIPEGEFALLDGRTKMITKAPIRLLSLSALDLRQRAVFWDIGFCTGSVSIEAKLQFPHLNVFSFEIREAGRSLMETNSRRLGTPGIEVVIGDFMDQDLSAYPRPDALFIGGHGGELIAMMQKIDQVLPSRGVVVFNSVAPESYRAFCQGTDLCGWMQEQPMQVALDQHNPITILKATKP